MRLQTPHPLGWLNLLGGWQVLQYVVCARGETAKCAGDAAGAEDEKVAQEPFEGYPVLFPLARGGRGEKGVGDLGNNFYERHWGLDKSQLVK